MLVVYRLRNVPSYNHHTAVRYFSSRAAFSKLSVSFVQSVVAVLMIIRRNMNTVKNYWLSRGMIIALHLFVNLLYIIL